ncbi:hypothetical protein BKH46_07465 [Helicobacter sp. 12S02634-8]|uniref:baseplate J/gp47 family protein n=1 Tax=Helicobacter sp. 12S02634-8 TaxID=1476199 RepID=UPI000BA7529A|nr:baseplate J/gp47 family protein [Helicobacter sp. 12S02634-8]PAF46419.1 hypothetical protein BKH46_07465 [Helicobacter sp. 12S02634-8]
MQLPSFLIPLDVSLEKNIILERFKESYPDYAPLIGDDLGVLMDCFVYRLNRYINYINYTIANNYLEFSSGEYLDSLVGLAGLKRFLGTPFIAQLKIKTTQPITLPKGTKFKDNKAHNAYLSQDESIDGEGIVSVELEDGLRDDFETISLEIPHIYISSIEKLTPFTQEKAPESDTDLKKRFLAYLATPSTAGNYKSYEYFSSIPQITQSKIIHRGLGEVEVIYSPKTADALEKLKESLQDKIPLTDQVYYTQATEIPIDLTITLTIKDNSQNTQIIQSVNDNIRGLFASLGIGENITESKIIAGSFVDTLIVNISVNGLKEATPKGILKLENLSILTQTQQTKNTENMGENNA